MGASSNSSLFFWGVGGVIKVRFLPKIAILRNKSASRGYIRPRLGELRPDIIMVDIQTRVGGFYPPDLAPRGSVGGGDEYESDASTLRGCVTWMRYVDRYVPRSVPRLSLVPSPNRCVTSMRYVDALCRCVMSMRYVDALCRKAK